MGLAGRPWGSGALTPLGTWGGGGPGAPWHDSLAPLGKWRVLGDNVKNKHKTSLTKLENHRAEQIASMLLWEEQSQKQRNTNAGNRDQTAGLTLFPPAT